MLGDAHSFLASARAVGWYLDVPQVWLGYPRDDTHEWLHMRESLQV